MPFIDIDLLCFRFRRHRPERHLLGVLLRCPPRPPAELVSISGSPFWFLLISFIFTFYLHRKKFNIRVGIVILIPRGRKYLFVYPALFTQKKNKRNLLSQKWTNVGQRR